MNDSDASFLDIDELRLEKEWLKQPSLYFTYAEKLARARMRMDDAKTNLDLVAAEMDKKVRDQPGRYGMDKVTEAAVKAAVLKSTPYREAIAEISTRRHRVDVLQAAVTALEHRKRALTMLVELYQSNYFADPRITAGREAREKIETDQKRSVRKIGKKKRDWTSDDRDEEEA